MKYIRKYQIAGFLIAAFVNFANTSEAASSIVHDHFTPILKKSLFTAGNTFLQTPDTTKLPYPLKPEDPFASDRKTPTSFNLNLPPNITVTVEFDPKTKQYTIYERVGKFDIKSPRVMSEEEYRDYQFENSMREYWHKQSRGQSTNAGFGLLPRLQVGGETFDRIFGSNTIEIIPQGNAELSFGINSSTTKNPQLALDMQRSTTFDFKSKIQMNVDGKIGEKLKMNVQYNTEATFDFENNVKVEYTGFEDEIIQKIEAGNVALPLPGTLITGSQSLFGFKTQLKFGKLNITTVFSKQNGQTQVIEVKGGAQSRDFSISANEYEANRHFFLSQYFRDHYNQALKNLPIINSGIVITKVEVWISNQMGNYENSRDIVGFVDLGELPSNIYKKDIFNLDKSGLYPDNLRNTLYSMFTDSIKYPDYAAGFRNISKAGDLLLKLEGRNFFEGIDYEKIRNARLLQPNEFTFNPNLGYISLGSDLPADRVLAVAYEYKVGGQTYTVGEFSNGGISSPKALIVKLIKGQKTLDPTFPTWNLMMKNIYSLKAYQVSPTDFRLDILYQNDAKGTSMNYIDGVLKNQPLIRILNLDNMDTQGKPNPDGVFDFIDGVTINATNGKITFPVLEPFGSDLKRAINDSIIAEKYIYPELYTRTITEATQLANKNKFKLVGTFQSSMGSEISLNAANIPKGSVVVTAAGAKLVEGTDYTVDYNMGSVKILKPGLIESGTPIKISLENNSLFNFQTKTLVGTHFDYKISEKFNIGATVLNLTERPLTQKVSFGNEAISNTIWGLNTSFQTEAPFLTKAVDLLPFIQTKEKSTITFDAEFAQFLPGYSRAIGKGGTVFIDDFESSTTPIDLSSPYNWKFASIPKYNELFPEGSLNDDLRSGFNRAKLAWYNIDPEFPRNTISGVRFSEKERSSQWVREVYEQELFPFKKSPQGQPTNLSILNLAYYPNERGIYNYDPNLTTNGFLPNPEKRWGGIMRPIGIPNFEEQNIEYIEFWLMDPFVYDTLKAGGDLYFNLGNISEDILLDGKPAFEGGLPITSELKNIETTVWGRVPKITSIPNEFVTTPDQKYQDIGLDGLSSKYSLTGGAENDEQSFFSEYLKQIQGITSSTAFSKIYNDPSNDDYKYFKDEDYTNNGVGIIDRYKDYNNLEGNTPNNSQGTGSAGSVKPDAEDINNDQNMSTTESYFQYHVSLRHADMKVGENYITDKVYSAKQKVNWYQFKVPIKDYKAYGSPTFTSVNSARMFLKGFNDTLILRFAKLQLVRGEWRKYELSLIEGQESVPGSDLSTGSFDISSVNLEDNSSRTPVNYVLPPGLSRTTDPNQNEVIEQNEQAMEYKVLNLADGDARAGFKNVTLDIRQYRNLYMDVHAEAIPGFTLKDGDLSLFIRLGTDYTSNYYEYEVPLKVTPEGRYNNNKEEDRLIVWPRENFFSISLESLTDAKLARNDEMHKAGSSINLSTVFVRMDGDHKIKVTGNPNLGEVKVLMIGVRNHGKSGTTTNDGLSKSAIIWVNELRLSNTDNKSGWAANARLSAKLADLGMVTLAGSTIKPGFGSIESKVSNRSTADFYQYDLSATLEMGKFFPMKSGIKIPLYIGYSESFSNPEFNPLDPDIPLKTAINKATTKAEQNDIKRVAQDYTRRKSINLTNVKIDRSGSKPWLLSLSNFSVSYSFSELLARNIKTDHRINREIRGAFTYNYNTNSKPIIPLKNVKWLSSKYLRLIKDFNFNPIPSQFSFRTDLNRSYYEQQLRNISNPNQYFLPTYSKDFLWNRVYTLNWDITQSIKFDFNATNVAQIDEPNGVVDRKYRDSYMHWRDSVMHNILNFGRTKQYNHQFNVSYNLPLSKIPILDWTSLTTRYTGNYRWDAGPILPDTSKFDPGNKIQNSNTIQVMGQLNLLGLYNKVGYLKRLNQKFDLMARGGNPQQKMTTIKYEVNDIRLKANAPKSINHRLKADKVTVKVYNEKGVEVKVVTEIKTNERLTIKADKDYEKLKVVVEGKVPEKTNPIKFIAEGTLRILMGVKSFSVSYSLNNGTFIPGYKPTTKYLGLNNVNGVTAPGFEFISGWQDPEFALKAIQNGWLSKDSTINKPVTFTNSENLTFRSTFEPIPNFKIELNAIRTYSKNIDEYYRANSQGIFNSPDPFTSGNFSMSVISVGTAFKSPNKIFENFRQSRITIAERLYNRRINTPNPLKPYEWGDATFPDGYSATSQQVLIPAFLATYSNFSPNTVTLDNFPKIPMPNWQVTYDGLAKIQPFKSYFKTFSLTHGYRSVYTIGSFATNLRYLEDVDGLSYVTNTINDFVPSRDISNVSISEQFSPLIGLDMNWINSLTTRFEVKTGRSLSMSFSNNQLTEVDSWEYILGTGYRFENLPLIFATDQGKQKTLKSDLRLRVDFSLRKNSTVLHKMVEEIDQVTSGQIATSIKASADYVISNQVTIRAFFDWAKNTPLVTGTSFPMVNTSFGFSLRFTMIQ